MGVRVCGGEGEGGGGEGADLAICLLLRVGLFQRPHVPLGDPADRLGSNPREDGEEGVRERGDE